jgi:hypothetical protein
MDPDDDARGQWPWAVAVADHSWSIEEVIGLLK